MEARPGHSATLTFRRIERDFDAGVAKQALTRSAERELTSRGATTANIARLKEKVYEPVYRILREDANAKLALAELEKETRSLIGNVMRPAHRLPIRGQSGPSLLPNLHAGIQVFAPPFDVAIDGPNRSGTSAVDLLNGTFGIELTSGGGLSGARWASAGASMALQAALSTIASIRPAWRYEYSSSAHGGPLSAHTEGKGRIAVQDAMSGHVLAERDLPMWNFDETRYEDDNGFLDAWALPNFVVQAGQVFTVSFLAMALVVDSGCTDWGFCSWASSFMSMHIPYFVVEMRQ